MPFGSGDISTIRSSGLWLAGIDTSGNLHGAVQMYNENGKSDFDSGILNFDSEIFEDVNLVWKVTKANIEAHLADFNDNGIVDNPLASIFGFPGRGNEFFTDYYPIFLPVNALGIGPFLDLDNNGFYEPDEGEYPIVQIRGCEDESFIADEMLWFSYHDLKVHSESQMQPLNLN